MMQAAVINPRTTILEEEKIVLLLFNR